MLALVDEGPAVELHYSCAPKRIITDPGRGKYPIGSRVKPLSVTTGLASGSVCGVARGLEQKLFELFVSAASADSVNCDCGWEQSSSSL